MDKINPSQGLGSINLARQIPAEKALRPAGFYKAIILDVLTVLAALGVSFVYRRYLDDFASLWLAIAAAALFALFSALQTFLLKSWLRRVIVLLLETAALFVFFYDRLSLSALALVGAVMFILFVLGELVSHRELSNGIEIRFFRSTKPLLSKLVTALAFFAIVLYLPQLNVERSLIPREAFDRVFESASGILSRLYPEVRFGGTFDDFAGDLSLLTLNQSPEFRLLPQDKRDQAVSKAVSETQSRFEKALGVDIKPADTLSDIFHGFLVKSLKGWQERFGNSFLAVWAIAVFLILRGFGTIFRVAVSVVIFFVYHGLLAADVIHIVGESRTHEIVEYS